MSRPTPARLRREPEAREQEEPQARTGRALRLLVAAGVAVSSLSHEYHFGSVLQLHSELYDPRTSSGHHLPEASGTKAGVHSRELRVVEHIEELGAKLRGEAFCRQRDHFVYGKVPVADARAANDSHARVSKGKR